jgi:hypothetical protein
MPLPLNAAQYQVMCRHDFYPFMYRSFRALNPDAHFFENWHNELIASKLQACHDGEITRLIINLPPRNLKSHAASICFPAFVLGNKPSAQIICASYGQQLADKLSLDCRTLMNSEYYRKLFQVRLSPRKQSAQDTDLFPRLPGTAKSGQKDGIGPTGFGMAWVESQGPLELLFGVGPVPLGVLDTRQGDVRFRQSIVERQSLLYVGAGFGHSHFWWQLV